MKRYILLVFLFFTAICLFADEMPQSAYEVYNLCLEADLTYGKGDFEQALNLYTIMENAAEEFPESKQWIQYYYYNIKQTDMVRSSIELADTEPEYLFRTLVLYLQNTDIKTINSESVELSGGESISDESIVRLEAAQNIFSEYIKILTNGRIKIIFERYSLDAGYTDVSQSVGYDYNSNPYEQNNPVLESIMPYPGLWFFRNMNYFDMIIIYWNDEGISGRPTGLFVNIPYIPYQLEGARRAVLQLPSVYTNAGTILHEFFHTLEQNYGISPGHGFLEKNRFHFSEWTGNSQFEYFKWHFDTTIRSKGYNLFHYKDLNPEYMTEEIIYYNTELLQDIPVDNIRQAYQLYKKAMESWYGDRTNLISLMQEAYNLNPYYPPLLTLLGRYEYELKDYTEAQEYIEESLSINPFNQLTNLWLGKVYQQEKNYERALVYFNRSIELDQNSASSYFYRGFYYYVIRDIERAVSDYIKCIDISPGYKTSIINFYTQMIQSDTVYAPVILQSVSSN